MKRSNFCGDCEHKRLADDLKNKTETEWSKKIKKHNFNFFEFRNLLFTVINSKDLPPEKVSVKFSDLINAYVFEENQKANLEFWQREQESN